MVDIDVFPCPFCGHDDVQIGEVSPGRFAVDCPECECVGPQGDTVEQAVAKWCAPHDKDLKLERLVREARHNAK
jgi:hypothetical protein